MSHLLVKLINLIQNMDGIGQEVRTYILEEYMDEGTQDFSDTTPLLSSGIIDSISALELVEFLEKTFDIEFQPHEVDQDNLDTVAKIVDFVKAKKAA